MIYQNIFEHVKTEMIVSDIELIVIPCSVVFWIIWARLFERSGIFWILSGFAIYLVILSLINLMGHWSLQPPNPADDTNTPIYWAAPVKLHIYLSSFLGYRYLPKILLTLILSGLCTAIPRKK
jgi:hypothetical protein